MNYAARITLSVLTGATTLLFGCSYVNPSERRVYELWNQANVLASSGKHRDAIEVWNRAIALKPGDKELYDNRGTSYLRNGDYDKALSDFDEAERLGHQYVDFGRGRVYFKLGQFQKALDACNKYLARTSGDPDAYLHRALIYDALGRTDDAKRDRAQAHKLYERLHEIDARD